MRSKSVSAIAPSRCAPIGPRAKTFLTLFALWLGACEDPLPQADETPEGAFVLKGVAIDDRRPDGSTWVGTAERAEGSLDLSDFERIELT
ncbi:MAG: hypothetical protein AAF658_17835, partial [Myxococcota bacterium]